MKESQMMATGKPEAGAPSTSISWESINWKSVKVHVRRLQIRIAKAVREGHHHKVKALQWLLTHSYNAKLLAIRRVTQNQGKDTPGVDGIVWKTSRQKMQAASEIKRRGYQPQPLRRIYIPKKDGHSKRPISIPAMINRGQQAIHLMALEPAVETIADRNSYGFRPDRSCADAIEQCFKVLARKDSATYTLEGDIESCFDTISKSWLLENTMMDKTVLKKWLEAGYVKALNHWTKRRHPEKSTHWRNNKYFRHEDNRNWIFHAKTLTKKGAVAVVDLFCASSIRIERHVKIRGDATDPTLKEYFAKRHAKRLAKVRALGLLGQLDGDGLRMARAV
jgi:N-terminal domain of reverse transcriptase/Reverse transcriptase (RNA-dependent DNA polymerase)